MRSAVVAEALPTNILQPTERYTPVEILSNHRARLLRLVEDFGPAVDGKFVFPNYMFLGAKPPSWFWGVTGVVRCIRGQVYGSELERVGADYLRLRLEYEERQVCTSPAYLEQAVVEVRSVDGRVIASVNMFGRNLKAQVVRC